MRADGGERPPAQPARNAVDSADRDAYDQVIRRLFPAADPEAGHIEVGEYFGALLNSPPLCALVSRFGTLVRTAGDRDDSYEHWEREFVDQVLSADWGTNVVQGTHLPDALSAGVRLEAIVALRSGREDELSEGERLLADYVRQVVSGTVEDASWRRIVSRLGLRGAVEYTGFILWLQWTMRMMQVLGVEDPPDDEIDRLLADLRSGDRPIPDYRERIR